MKEHDPRKAMKKTKRQLFCVALVTASWFSTTMLVEAYARGAEPCPPDAKTFAIIVGRPKHVPLTGSTDPTTGATLPPSQNSQIVKELGDKVGMECYEKLLKNVTRKNHRAINFYKPGETPIECADRTYCLDFEFVGQGGDESATGGDEWRQAVDLYVPLRKCNEVEKLTIDLGTEVKTGKIRSQRFRDVESVMCGLLSNPKVVPDGLTLEKRISEERERPPRRNRPLPTEPEQGKKLEKNIPVEFVFNFDFNSPKLHLGPDRVGRENETKLADLVTRVTYFFAVHEKNGTKGVVLIAGHASKEPVSDPERTKKLQRQVFHNQTLSEARATTIEQILRKAKVVGEIRKVGFGDTRPKPPPRGSTDSNATEEGRKANRRVEITAN